ncbi:AtpZ/AtpI family protein [Hymenobacter chitinivorans]|uniref:Putative F0F1-ATPase subunit (Ca2+/Mg2+ transporter) n=1 Tax=Hymenobacter chitinivorans DSM 11115 TaxID=1121954 RepID=A0A2M9ASE8_9BACT|nr:AtpZ/AtpI family protein [Hymenobacter chitinivorans]PJJ48635.1 putative F0F1-ATPase subunit (Ca2+/Mg2+ transporter) [Hymenobacter chitinivorans DSM 11115]
MAAAPSSPQDPNETDRLRAFAKYSGLGFQMLAIIGVCAWGGVKLDEYTHNDKPWYTIGLMVFGLIAATYQVIRSLSRNE